MPRSLGGVGYRKAEYFAEGVSLGGDQDVAREFRVEKERDREEGRRVLRGHSLKKYWRKRRLGKGVELRE